MDSLRHIYGLYLALFVATSLSGQALHLTSYAHAPISLSPAMTGAYAGSARVGATTREQYREFLTQPYTSSNVYIDSPLALGLPEQQWVGVGLEINNSIDGALSLTRQNITTAVSYHMALDKKYKTVIGMGLAYTYQRKNIDNSNGANFEDEVLGLIDRSQDHNLLENFSAINNGLHLGIYLKKKYSKKLSYRIGAAVREVYNTSNKRSDLNATTAHRQIIMHADWDYKLNKVVSLSPTLLYQKIPYSTNATGLLGIRHKVLKDENLILTYQIGYRWKDAGLTVLGAEYKNYTFTIGYDMTLSSATNYNGLYGAFEIGLSKVFIIHPKVKEKIIQFCPRL